MRDVVGYCRIDNMDETREGKERPLVDVLRGGGGSGREEKKEDGRAERGRQRA